MGDCYYHYGSHLDISLKFYSFDDAGTKTRAVQSDKGALQKPTQHAIELAQLKTMEEVRRIFKQSDAGDETM